MVDEERQDTPQDEPTPEGVEEPTAEQPEAAEPAGEQEEAPQAAGEEAAEAEAPASTPEEAAPAAEAETPAAETPAAETPAAETPAAEAETPAEEERKPKPKRDRKKDDADKPEVIPGAHLEPDLVLEDEARSDEPTYTGAEVDVVDEAPADGEATAEPQATDEDETAQPLEAVLNLAADARYRATGKRKNAVARVTLKPGTGQYTINGRTLDEYFPRATLQTKARRPLEIVAQQDKMDVVAKIHGGGVSAQAGALRHGITRALVEADPNLRGELKRRGFLTRDPRVKERKKAGLKKARKRPQFSKR
jgi:small subunit ribosomal protein S9